MASYLAAVSNLGEQFMNAKEYFSLFTNLKSIFSDFVDNLMKMKNLIQELSSTSQDIFPLFSSDPTTVTVSTILQKYLNQCRELQIPSAANITIAVEEIGRTVQELKDWNWATENSSKKSCCFATTSNKKNNSSVKPFVDQFTVEMEQCYNQLQGHVARQCMEQFTSCSEELKQLFVSQQFSDQIISQLKESMTQFPKQIIEQQFQTLSELKNNVLDFQSWKQLLSDNTSREEQVTIILEKCNAFFTVYQQLQQSYVSLFGTQIINEVMKPFTNVMDQTQKILTKNAISLQASLSNDVLQQVTQFATIFQQNMKEITQKATGDLQNYLQTKTNRLEKSTADLTQFCKSINVIQNELVKSGDFEKLIKTMTKYYELFSTLQEICGTQQRIFESLDEQMNKLKSCMETVIRYLLENVIFGLADRMPSTPSMESVTNKFSSLKTSFGFGATSSVEENTSLESVTVELVPQEQETAATNLFAKGKNLIGSFWNTSNAATTEE